MGRGYHQGGRFILMLALIQGQVETVDASAPEALRLTVRTECGVRHAIAYTELIGPVLAGDRVLLNTWAVELALGTGGTDFVVSVDRPVRRAEPPGHIMKLRYTPLQVPVAAVEAPESPHHSAMRRFATLSAMPVVCAELHSQIPAIAAAAKWQTDGDARIAYIMTDGAALPAALSRLIPRMRERGLIDCCITAGQAFGGDLEAVNIYSALAAAQTVAKCDIAIVGQGPGNAGTETPLGFSGMDQAIALNAASGLDATPIAAVRLSFADPRPRHVGLSHHTGTVLSCGTLCPALVPIPRLSSPEDASLRRRLSSMGILHRHEVITVHAEPALEALLATGIEVTTMGRGIQEERAFFLAAGAAGLVAGQWLEGIDLNNEATRTEAAPFP